jgi:hypothetical protein
LKIAPGFGRDRGSEAPVDVNAFAAGQNDEGGFWKVEFLPCCDLPIDGAIVPFDKEGITGRDLSVGVAAVIDDGINAAAFLLPSDDFIRGEGSLASTVFRLEKVARWQESAKASFVRLFAEESEEGLGCFLIERERACDGSHGAREQIE